MCDNKDNLYYVFSENGFSSDFTNNGEGLHVLSIKTGAYEKMTKEKYNNDFKENFFILAETEIPYDFAYRNENSQIKFN